MTDDLQKQLDKAKIGLMRLPNSVFITTVLFSMRLKWDNSIPTAATNGLDLFINEKFFGGLSHDVRMFVLAHEAWHTAFKHMVRLGSRDLTQWNIAADHVINLMLKKSGFTLLDGIYCDDKYTGMSAEQVYTQLIKEKEKKDKKPNVMNDLIPAGDSPPAGSTGQSVDQQLDKVLQKARTRSLLGGDARGTIPGDVEVALNKLLKPQLPWHVLLMRFAQDICKAEYTFRKPNRRFMPDYYLPSLHGEGVKEIAIAFDTSGSVSPHQATGIVSEMEHIKNTINPEKTNIVNFDTRIQNTYTLYEYDKVTDLTFKGRGGTSLKCVFDHFENKPLKFLVVFSDLKCPRIKTAPPYPVIWVVVDNPKAEVNFGQVIHYDSRA